MKLNQNTAQKIRFSIKDSSFLRIWSHLLKKSLMENFIFCAVKGRFYHDNYEKAKFNLFNSDASLHFNGFQSSVLGIFHIWRQPKNK